MKKIYYLSTCNTCKRIIQEINLPKSFKKQDIKKESITLEDLTRLYGFTGSYEALFNKRARMYKEQLMKNNILQEEDYKKLLLDHYTFLKRPVIINDDEIFIGNSKKIVEFAKIAINKEP